MCSCCLGAWLCWGQYSFLFHGLSENTKSRGKKNKKMGTAIMEPSAELIYCTTYFFRDFNKKLHILFLILQDAAELFQALVIYSKQG